GRVETHASGGEHQEPSSGKALAVGVGRSRGDGGGGEPDAFKAQPGGGRDPGLALAMAGVQRQGQHPQRPRVSGQRLTGVCLQLDPACGPTRAARRLTAFVPGGEPFCIGMHRSALGGRQLEDSRSVGALSQQAQGPRAVRRRGGWTDGDAARSEEHTSELQSRENLVCRLLLEKKKKQTRCAKKGDRRPTAARRSAEAGRKNLRAGEYAPLNRRAPSPPRSAQRRARRARPLPAT